MTSSQIEKVAKNLWKEKEPVLSSPNISSVKSFKRTKSPKKVLENNKKSTNDLKLEDVFLNSEYFKYHSGNISSLSFCSGDNGENQWKIDSKFEMQPKQKPAKAISCPNDVIKSDTAVVEMSKAARQVQQKVKSKPGTCVTKENSEEKTNKLLEGILSGQGRLDRDLITLITEQMYLAERELQITRTHLVETMGKLNERDLEILQLHEKIQNLQKSKKIDNSKTSDPTAKTSEDYQRLIQASDKLKKQVKDMEDFLNDYGLVWVGEKDTKPDFDKILKNFQRLNSVASEPKIIQTNMGAKFELPREIPLVLYSNGLLLRNTEFREYSNVATSLFLQDVEDGYFPSELQLEFPEGVPFEVIDKRNEIYSPNSKTQVFQGHGNRLGSTNEGKPAAIVYLDPPKKPRNYETRTSIEALKKFNKKRPRKTYSQNDNSFPFLSDVPCTRPNSGNSEQEGEGSKRQELNVKVRFWKGNTESFVLRISEREKMFSFQVALQRKLCERFHDECLLHSDANTKSTDFEVHVYGRNPFRLSDRLNDYPWECGIVNNCVINVSEI